MREESLADARHLDRQATAPVEIGRGAQGTIVLDTASGIVCKQFYTPDASELAQREFDCLQRFSAALAGHPLLHCPKPVGVDPAQGKIWMTYCPGSQLDHILAAAGGDIDEHLTHIAGQIAIAIECYIAEFNEPYYSINLWNMLYDMPTRELHPIDLTSMSRDRLHHFEANHAALDVSLGKYIGTSIYDSVRPATWRNQTYWKRQTQLSGAVLALLNDRHDLDLSLIREISHVAYDSIANKGKPARRLWYRTVGQLLFNHRSRAITAHARQWTVERAGAHE